MRFDCFFAAVAKTRQAFWRAILQNSTIAISILNIYV